jgi:Arc/MetJ-type ribon-helix-helix transcriptional regulator
VNITINVDEVTLDTIVGEVLGFDEDGDPVTKDERTIADTVAEKITAALVKDDRWDSMRKKVLEIRSEVIREALKPVVEQALTETFQRTNNYGEPIGGVISMRQVITDELKQFMTQPADTYNRDKGTVLQVFVRKAVAEVLTTEVQEAVRQAREQFAGEIGKQVTAAVQAGLRAK